MSSGSGSSPMAALGIEIMPNMPMAEIIDTICAAEHLGFEYCLLTDEGLMREVYAVLGVAALKTSRIRLSPVTNGYTRHPAITAAGIATLNEISSGRAFITLVAGGSMVLQPLGIERQSPLMVAEETVHILRSLWSGEPVTWRGEKYSLVNASLSAETSQVPIWIAARGPKMLSLAGKESEGVVLMGKSDLPEALEVVKRGSAGRAQPPKRIYLDRLAFTPEMLSESAVLYAYSIVDAPARMLKNLGIDEEHRQAIQSALEKEGEQSAERLVNPEMINKFQIAGTPEECKRSLNELILHHQLDVFILDLTTPGLEANIRLMEQTLKILHG